MTGASDWRRDVVDRVGGLLVATLGTRPWAAGGWRWPAASVDQLAEALRDAMPGLRIIGAVVPRQANRERLSLLGRYAGNPVVVKLGSDGAATSLATEGRVLSLLTDRPLPGIETPAVVAHDTIDLGGVPCEFLATSAVGLGAQRAALDAPLRTFERDLTERLAPLAPPGRAPDDVAVHGDLTPWNLRRTRRGLALFDWESAGWGHAGSDLTHYRAACDAVRPWWSRDGGRTSR
ncbi:MAG: phosphotransferase [Ilumatobacter sp.]|nr:phosphotransferase [Ilumatobacter sp.]